MRKILLLLLLSVSFLSAKTDQNTTNPITKLNLVIGATTLNKETNTTLKVEATYKDKTTKDITNQAQWLITPRDAVKITDHTLTALNDTNITVQAKAGNTTSNQVKLSIYWEVDGHRLPPEPDPKVNNSTLLGVDVNKNGVRDDVERWIYKTYKHPIERGVFMQHSRAYNSLLTTQPTKHKVNTEMKKLISCQFYLEKTNKYIGKKYEYEYYSTKIFPIQFNTVERLIAKHKYEKALSGGVYDITKANKENCEFDENGILMDLK